MNAMTDSRIGVWAAPVLVFLVAVHSAHAECGPSQRIALNDAECLSGGFENRTWPRKDIAWVKSECSDYGTVVAKVDRKDAPDWTKWLEGDATENMSGSQGNIRAISCCSDIGDLCNKEDVINPQNCLADFKRSVAGTARIDVRDASSPKKVTDVTVTSNAEDETCTIGGNVTIRDPSGNLHTRWAEITVNFRHAINLKVCSYYSGNTVAHILFCT